MKAIIGLFSSSYSVIAFVTFFDTVNSLLLSTLLSPEIPNFIKYKLISEDSVEYLIQLGIAGLKRVLHNNEFTTSQKVESAITEYEEENNPVIAFINEVGEDAIINQPTNEVYLRYSTFCSQSQLQALSKIAFSKAINKRLGTVAVSRRVNGTVTRIFVEVVQ